jgi:hypothetical protein
MTYQGSCHCGGIKYTVEGTIGQVIDCNCSLCRRRGGLLWFVPHDDFQLETDADDLGTYRFNTHKLAHHFCPTCGVAPYSEGVDPRGRAMVAINVRCLDGVDLQTLKISPFDGLSY